jgi:hypothetical protein
MKDLVYKLIAFIKLHPLKMWVLLLVFCSISVSLNYKFDLENSFRNYSPILEFCAFVMMYTIHFFGAYFIYSLSTKNFGFWKQKNFLFLMAFSVLIFALRAVAVFQYSLIEYLTIDGNIGLNGMIYNDVFRFLLLAIPVAFIWYFFDRNQNLYGISLKNHHSKIYFILLACMVPLIIGASFLSDFLDYYPRASKLDRFQANIWQYWAFELFYGIDFISIELFFRGFLIMAFIKYVGPFCILPMASFYLSIHYGKPMGEAISSFFGGTILGVISFYSRSIFGGVMVHVGIAWLMELGAFIGNWFRH